MQYLSAISKQQNDLCLFQGKPFNITVIQVYALTSNTEEAEAEWFYEDQQDLLQLTPQKDVLFIIGDWKVKVGSQEILQFSSVAQLCLTPSTPGLLVHEKEILRVTGKFGLGVQNEAEQRLTEVCQENTLVIANSLFQQHKRRL